MRRWLACCGGSIEINWGKRRSSGRALIGPLGAVSLADARAKAAEAGRLLHDGEEPKLLWRKKPGVREQTFGSIAIEHIEAHEPSWRNPKHRQQWRNPRKTYASAIWERL